MEYLDFAKEIAYEAGKILRRGYVSYREISSKLGRELVTNIDIESEKYLRSMINAKYPEHNILAEEFGGKIEKDGFLWIIEQMEYKVVPLLMRFSYHLSSISVGYIRYSGTS